MSKELRYVPMPGNRIGRGESELNPSSPEWHPDNSNKTCELCENGFTFFNRRHHCRNCGRVVCGKCLIKYSRSSESHLFQFVSYVLIALFRVTKMMTHVLII